MKSAIENKLKRAAEIVLEQRIREVDRPRVFAVRSVSGEGYLVTLAKSATLGTGTPPPRWSCTCAWGRSDAHPSDVCSHFLAADAVVKSERDPFEGGD